VLIFHVYPYQLILQTFLQLDFITVLILGPISEIPNDQQIGFNINSKEFLINEKHFSDRNILDLVVIKTEINKDLLKKYRHIYLINVERPSIENVSFF
jgi:hypothetical protein